MSNRLVVPELHLCVGEKCDFAIELLLPPDTQHGYQTIGSSTSVLELTDGYLAFFIKGVNPSQITASDSVPIASHFFTTLSKFLEWVFFDKAYLPKDETICLSEMVDGESSPPINFSRENDAIVVAWDFREYTRNGLRYAKPIGGGTIDYRKYLLVLSMAVDGLIMAFNWRSNVLRQNGWHEWIAGYEDELKAFRDFVKLTLANHDPIDST